MDAAGPGRLTELSPILLPLDSVKDQVTVVTNLRLQNAYPARTTPRTPDS